MMQKPLKLICLFFILIAFVGCERDRGFTLKKITSYHNNHSKWNVHPPSLDEQKELCRIFSAPFTYLGSGNHCYAFASEDGKYVMKFFKQKHMRTQFLIDYLPLPAKSLFYPTKKYLRRHKERVKSFNSYKIAFEHLKKETGLFYLHLNKTKTLAKEVTLIDQHGNEILVNIDEMEFLIQKRAEVGYRKLDFLFAQGLKEEALESIASIMTIVKTRIEKGFSDKDLQFYKNFGFIGSTAIEIDIGEIQKALTSRNLQDIRNELTEFSFQISEWVESHYPEYKADVDRTILDMINQARES